MKIFTGQGIYIQKKDLELIFLITKDDKIPNSFMNKFNQNINIKDMAFMFFDQQDEINFLNNFWFIIDYNEIIEFSEIESLNYYYNDLQNLRKMRVEHDKYKFLPQKKIYNSYLDLMVDENRYFNYLPPKNQVNNYPLEFRLLYNKVMDVLELNHFKRGISNLEIPKEVFVPIRFSKKQLQQIYYGVLSESLTFEELKPYEKQLYSIFSRINYTPDIEEILRKIILINRYNTLDFINDELLDILLRFEGKNGKFDESTSCLIDYLYVIGYNRFENYESKIILEKDIRIVKSVMRNIVISQLIDRYRVEEKYINKFANYNYVLAEIVRSVQKCNCSQCYSQIVSDIFSNMLTFVYLNPEAINCRYDFLSQVYEYISNNTSELVGLFNYKIKNDEGYGEQFLTNFNNSNKLLLHLYNQKYKENKNLQKLVEQNEQDIME